MTSIEKLRGRSRIRTYDFHRVKVECIAETRQISACNQWNHTPGLSTLGLALTRIGCEKGCAVFEGGR